MTFWSLPAAPPSASKFSPRVVVLFTSEKGTESAGESICPTLRSTQLPAACAKLSGADRVGSTVTGLRIWVKMSSVGAFRLMP